MAARLETIGAQDLINALSRAERLGYHVNDIVQKQPGPGGETVIPSMSAVPPMPPHHSRVGAPPPAMAPYQVQGPPQQRQPYGSHMNSMSYPAGQDPSQTPKRSAPALPSWVKQCQMCKRPCSSDEALSYVSIPLLLKACGKPNILIMELASEKGQVPNFKPSPNSG